MSSIDPGAVLSGDEIEAIRLDAIGEAEEGRIRTVVDKLEALAKAYDGRPDRGLATSARMLARQSPA